MLGTANTARLSRTGYPAQAQVSTVIRYAAQLYSQSALSYVGPDSSNRPVFMFAYANASNLLCAQLFRVNSDASITQGSEQSEGSASVSRTVQAMSEYEGANSFLNGTPTAHVYLCYVNNAVTSSFGQVASTDVNALTCTFGTAVSLGMTPDADQPAVAFVGNSRAVMGARTGSGSTVKRYSRSGTTLTAEGTASADLVYRIDSAQLGFENDGSTQYRSSFFATGNGASGTVFGGSAQGATNYSATNTSITGTDLNSGCNLNNTNKMLGVHQTGSTQSVIAIETTWNSASAPSFATGSAVTMSDVVAGGSWKPVSGFATDTAFVVYNSNSSTVDIRPVTVSGTTVTLGTKQNVIRGLSSIDSQMSVSSAVIGTTTWLAGVQTRTSGAPYIWGARLA